MRVRLHHVVGPIGFTASGSSSSPSDDSSEQYGIGAKYGGPYGCVRGVGVGGKEGERLPRRLVKRRVRDLGRDGDGSVSEPGLRGLEGNFAQGLLNEMVGFFNFGLTWGGRQQWHK